MWFQSGYTNAEVIDLLLNVTTGLLSYVQIGMHINEIQVKLLETKKQREKQRSREKQRERQTDGVGLTDRQRDKQMEIGRTQRETQRWRGPDSQTER